MMIVAFAISLVLAIFGAVVIQAIFFKLYSLFNQEYEEFLEKQKKLEKTRKSLKINQKAS